MAAAGQANINDASPEDDSKKQSPNARKADDPVILVVDEHLPMEWENTFLDAPVDSEERKDDSEEEEGEEEEEEEEEDFVVARQTSPNAMSDTMSETMSDTGDSMDRIGHLERAAEVKKLQAERKNNQTEVALDVFALVFKIAAFVKSYFTDNEDSTLPIQAVLLGSAVVLIVWSISWRYSELKKMSFLVEHGYCKHWRSADRLVGSGKVDPRVENDAAARLKRHMEIRSAQAIFADLPWAIFGIIKSSNSEGDIFVLIAMTFAGYSLGEKFANFQNLVKARLFSTGAVKKVVYQSLPAEIKIGTGTSTKKYTDAAVEDAYRHVCGQLSDTPTFMIIVMNATCDHKKGLQKIVELAPGVPFAGGTTCQGVMTARSSLREDGVVAIWAIYDPEGVYSTQIFPHAADGQGIVKGASKIARRAKKASPSRKILSDSCTKTSSFFSSDTNDTPVGKYGTNDEKIKPSFIFLMSAPGTEDQVLTGFGKGMRGVPIIGGSSADNDITGKWKQWASVPKEDSQGKGFRMESNGCSTCFVWCSAVVQSQLFTGYSATGKVGTITKTDGLRHILEIDGKCSSKVYNDWTGNEYATQLADPEDSNILGPSSLYPLGQICGEDLEGEPVYRSMHPHLLVKKSESVTLFSDVQVGEQICMMAGTKENIVNRIAGVATQIVNNAEFSLQEVRGAFVVFCAGCMMYADDRMDDSCDKLFTAIGGTPYLGVHTFGEQGMFPDGKNRHGNLMFSAIVFSSKRRIVKLLNVDTGKEVSEDDPEFKQIVLTATVC